MKTDYPIIDADVHNQFPAISALAPYLPDTDPEAYYNRGSGVINTGGAYRKDSEPPGGRMPGSDPAFTIENHIETYGIDRAVLNPGSLLGLGGLPDLDLAARLASATNDWTINEWFASDERFLGTILIAPRDPELAAAEVRRLGNHPRMVQVGMTSAPCLLGNRFLDPIYAACEEFGLPLNIHVGGAEAGVNSGSYAVGAPSTFVEHHIGMCVPAIHHLVSVLTEGVFVRCPGVRLIFNEFGVAWLPFVMWRLDMEYRAARQDVPWLTKLPSEYVKESVRFTTQPLEEPKNPKDLVTLLSLINGDDILCFSSDYPHWDSDNPDLALKAFPEDWKRKVFYENSKELFHLNDDLVREPAPAGAAS
jgi:predicted TIM-barrel fold metal-dependent hydrolase